MVCLSVLGLNCGTSVDGIDVAHCMISSIENSSNVKIELLSYTEIPVNPELRSHVLKLCREGASTTLAEVCDLNFKLGKQFADATLDSGVDLNQVDIIASHGQTLWHKPTGGDRSTLQMAEPAVIAHGTKKTVVSGFRVAELAAGRQGAPLSGFFEAGLLSHPDITRVSQNIGGIGNASVVPAADKSRFNSDGSYLAFDTGPGNVFIDAAMRLLSDGTKQFDKDGELGAKGEADIDETFVDEFLASEPYFDMELPKTTGRELFSDDVAKGLVSKLRQRNKSTEAIVATITRITAESIARAYEQFILPLLQEGSTIDEIYLCGGGAHNPNIFNHIKSRFPQSRVMKLDEAPFKLDPSAKEAVLFALLGYLAVCGRRIPLAADAETKDPAILGVVTPGANYSDVMKAIVADEEFGSWSTLGRIIMEGNPLSPMPGTRTREGVGDAIAEDHASVFPISDTACLIVQYRV